MCITADQNCHFLNFETNIWNQNRYTKKLVEIVQITMTKVHKSNGKL